MGEQSAGTALLPCFWQMMQSVLALSRRGGGKRSPGWRPALLCPLLANCSLQIRSCCSCCACREGGEAAAASAALLAEVPGAKIFYITGGAEAWRVRARLPEASCQPACLPASQPACLARHGCNLQCRIVLIRLDSAARPPASWPALSSHHPPTHPPTCCCCCYLPACLPAGGGRPLEGARHPVPARAEPGGPQQQHQQHRWRREGAG